MGLAIAEAACTSNRVLLVALEDQHRLEMLETEIRYFLGPSGSEMVHHFPGWECLPYDNFSPYQDIISKRLRLLSRLPDMQSAVVLIHCADLMQRLPPTDYILSHTFSLHRNQKVDLQRLQSRLVQSNYVSVTQVMSPGEFAVRGGLIDIFPMGSDIPFRLDLFDQDIESIRLFDPETQRSREKINAIELLPAREFPVTEEGVQQFRSSFRKRFEGDPSQQRMYREISMGIVPPGSEFFFPLFFDSTSTIFDYLYEKTIFVQTAEQSNFLLTQWAEIKDRHTSARADATRKTLDPEELYLHPDEVHEAIQGYSRIRTLGDHPVQATWQAAVQPSPYYPVNPRKEAPYQSLVTHLKETGNRVLMIAGSPGRREALDGVLMHNGLPGSPVPDFHEFPDSDTALGLTVAPLERGLVLPDAGIEMICESQLYGDRVHQKRQRSAQSRNPDAIIKSLAELNIGDPVVHIEHGVGRFIGLQVLTISDEKSEFLAIEYLDHDKLFIPVLSLDRISRFVGGSPDQAPLHRLGGDQWEKSKKRARDKAYDVATELLEVEALRNARKGHPFDPDQEAFDRFCSQFSFEETPDQQQAIEEMLGDLYSAEPMDRLICGDVGFGKTEVALRAAFIVAMSGKQVGILTPTTLLAQQHYQTFTDRFADWPVTIAMLSRFNTPRQVRETLAQLEGGTLDIVIGTHRLLQRDIAFRDLGLLIIDEEHRFGVRQKEKIKRIRSQVDILTLTATPIPRTLNISLAGLRSISIIGSPPVNRLSIKTFVREWDTGLIREACLREIRRGGQVFFLHNDVRSIERMARDLAELVPEAQINIGHGKMSEIRLERVMRDFYHQRFNLLLCTTIIESGIDIPSANTIIINRADRFGLAQLHQIRGRVGRSHHQAFAYLLIPDRNTITSNAQKRLDAIESMRDLGAGFALASHDLEIRGAGELLGETQSGLIDDVGFFLYSEYLALAVKDIKQDHSPLVEQAFDLEKETTVDLHLPALFPEDYLPNPQIRLTLYKRISSSPTLENLRELQIEVIDRFGLLPEAGRNLFQLAALQRKADQVGIHKLDIGPRGGRIEFHEKPAIDPGVIFSMIQGAPQKYRLSASHVFHITDDLEDPVARIEEIHALMDTLLHSRPDHFPGNIPSLPDDHPGTLLQ